MNAKDLLRALRTGTVPKDGVGEIIVGNENILSELMGELNEIKTAKSSSIRFIQGNFGSGKTMLTTYLMEQALSMNYCVSQIIIDPTVQLGNFPQVYNAFCQNLRTPQSLDSSGMVNILEGWSLRQLNMYKSIEGLNSATLDSSQCNDYIAHLENELISVRNLDPSLSRAISAYAGGKVQKNSEISKYALDWIRASDKIPSKDYSKQLGLKGKINGDDAYNFLKGILFLVKEAGYAGSLIVLDEVETVRRLPQKNIRLKAYEILRHILDDTSAGQFSNAFFLITATWEFFNDRNGIKEYPALEERIKQIQIKNADKSSYKQPILEIKPMKEMELGQLAAKIRRIHGEAENWDIMCKVSDSNLSALTGYLVKGALGVKESGPRDFLRRLVEAFDVLRENPEKTVMELIPTSGEFDG